MKLMLLFQQVSALFDVSSIYILDIVQIRPQINIPLLACAEKWDKDFFTNGDIVMLMSAIQELGTKNYRETLHKIVSSRCETSFTKYQIWQKAQQVQSRITTRKSRRKKLSPTGNMTMFGVTGSGIFSLTYVLRFTDNTSFLSKIFKIPSPRKKNTGPCTPLNVKNNGSTTPLMLQKSNCRRSKNSNPAQIRYNKKQKREHRVRSNPAKKVDLRKTPPRMSSVVHRYV